MKITRSDKAIAYLALISGLSISAVAIYYSVAGLVAIFAAAAIPIIVMGTVLEISKLAATVWLKHNWAIAPKMIRAYLLASILILMAITSMGIFGYLSKAHLDQAVPTSDIAAKVAIIDEKIKTERDNIESARNALKQMDATVDQTIARSKDERGATNAANLRRSQAKERTQLQADISKAQANIAKLNEERAPIAADLRKVEAKVGPIKYIAAMIYGDNPDNDLLERSVRWAIMLIVIVFDPLAVILLLASQYSFAWFRKQSEDSPSVDTPIEPIIEKVNPPQEPIEPVKQEPTLSKDSYIEVEQPTTPVEEEKTVQTTEVPAEETDSSKKNSEQLTLDYDLDNQYTVSEKLAMRRWKKENPNDTIHAAQLKKQLGLIDQLPWEEQLVKDALNEQEETEESKKKNYMTRDSEGRIIVRAKK